MTIQKNNLSRFSLYVGTAAVFILIIAFLTAFPRPYSVKKQSIDSFVDQTIDQWQSKYSSMKGLKVARVDIHFTAQPKNFSDGEGAVVTPVGLDLPQGQKILEIAAWPPIIRKLPVDGILCLAWPYPGKCRDNFNYVSLCLVQQQTSGSLKWPENPTFNNLPPAFVSDALASADEIEEHSLHECAVFKKWAKTIAGTGPYMNQFKTIVINISGGIIADDKNNNDDICEAIRKNKFSTHRAHVTAVMACREVGIPCFGFSGALESKNHILGTFCDQTGWIYFDMDHPEKGFFTDPPVILAYAPLIKSFQACQHDFWKPNAAAYGNVGYMDNIGAFSQTEWGKDSMDTDVTIARTFLLDEI